MFWFWLMNSVSITELLNLFELHFPPLYIGNNDVMMLLLSVKVVE